MSDIVDANILAMAPGKIGVFNVGTGVETPDQQIFELIARILGFCGDPNYAPVRQGEIYRICLDFSKAKSELVWEPRVPLQEGLTEAISYYKEISQRG